MRVGRYLINWACSCLLFSFAAMAQAENQIAAGSVIRFCADDAQWPPYSYTSGDGNEVKGFTVELIRKALSEQGITAEIKQVPWRRCLAESKRGVLFQVALDSSWSEEREKNYLLTLPYYQLTPYYFYSRNHFPDGLSVQSGSQLSNNGTICGLPGYNYGNFAIGKQSVYIGATDFHSLAEMTHRGRCGLFLGRFEIVSGLARISDDLLADQRLAWAPIPDARPEPFHMMISRNYSAAAELKLILDQAITRMQQNGELELLLRRYQ